MSFEHLFSPIKIRGMEMKNRIFLPAMWTRTVTMQEGIVTQQLIDYHVARAKGGCGLNLTEVCAVHRSAKGRSFMGLYNDEQQAGIKRLVDAVHEAGGKIGVQIWHGGTVAVANLPADVPPMLTETMTLDDIKMIVKAFGDAARRAVATGCDCLEFHAAHTYLPHTFLSPGLNQRSDEYSGSLENRARFMLEVIESMRANMPEDMPLFMRIDAQDDYLTENLSVDDIIQVCQWAREKGVDVIDVSRGNGKSLALVFEVPSIDTPNAYNKDNVAKIRKGTGMLTSIAGRVNTPELAEKLLAEGVCDLIAMGRSQIADPDFCNKAKAGDVENIRLCMGCDVGCFDVTSEPFGPTSTPIRCTRNPFVCREGQPHIFRKAAAPKKVLVAGGGYGGLITANMLKAKGHTPIVCEASSQLGGAMLMAGKNEYKKEMAQAVHWEAKQCEKNGIEIRLNTPVTPALIEEIKPEAVIIAIGGKPYLPDYVTGLEQPNVYTYLDVMTDKVALSGDVVIVGGKLYGLETALYLASKGAKVTILEAKDKTGADLGWIRGMHMMVNVPTAGIKTITGATCLSVGEKEITYRTKEGMASLPCDAVVFATGASPLCSDDLQVTCQKLDIPYFVIGDAKNPRTALYASSEGADAVLQLS